MTKGKTEMAMKEEGRDISIWMGKSKEDMGKCSRIIFMIDQEFDQEIDQENRSQFGKMDSVKD